MANSAIYHPGPHDLPALGAWSEDPFFEDHPLALREAAQRVFALKNQPAQGDLAATIRLVTDETARPMAHPLPGSFLATQNIEGHALFLTTLLLFRRHLPTGFLASTLLPLLVLPEKTPCALILPGRFWPDALKDR